MKEPGDKFNPFDLFWVAAVVAAIWHNLPDSVIPDMSVKDTQLTRTLDKDPVCIQKARETINKFATVLVEDGQREKPKCPDFVTAQQRLADMGDVIVGVNANWSVEHPQFDDVLASLVQDVGPSEGWRTRLAERLRSIAENEL